MELALLHPAIILDPSDKQPELLGPIPKLLERVERALESPNSRRAYRTSLLHFFTWCRSQSSVSRLCRLAALQYKDFRDRHRHLSVLRHILRMMVTNAPTDIEQCGDKTTLFSLPLLTQLVDHRL